MDQVVCHECVEMIFIHASMACGRLVLHFRPGEPVGKLESTLTTGKSPEIIQNGQILLCLAPQVGAYHNRKYIVDKKVTFIFSDASSGLRAIILIFLDSLSAKYCF